MCLPTFPTEGSADSEANFVQSKVAAVYSFDDEDNNVDDLSLRSSVVWASDQEDGHASMAVDEEEESWVGSSGDGDLSKEEMDAMEDNVFWETCMAIGLVHVDLSLNRLEGTILAFFNEMKNLKYLNLDNSFFHGILPFYESFLKQLHYYIVRSGAQDRSLRQARPPTISSTAR
ncbi:hypothetical protein NL676_009296 [Syzygium grande]|nr:hypothetical protein NL676_009296 [Syzygium grande]